MTDLFDMFRKEMIAAINDAENLNDDSSVNWNYVDSDMYEVYGGVLVEPIYYDWFNEVADEIEGVAA